MKHNPLIVTGAVLAGVSIIGPAEAATQIVEESFAFGWANQFSEVLLVDIDPFLGSADQLTSVSFSLDSRFLFQESASGFTSSSSTTLFARFAETSVFGISGQDGLTELTVLDYEMLDNGATASDFVSGPVTLRLGIDVEEATSTGIWYAGVGIPFTDPPLEQYGGVTVTYTYDDNVPSVPLPASLPLTAGGIALLAGINAGRKRRKS